MRKLLSIAVLSMTAFGMILISCNAQAPKANLKTDADTLSYALGISLSQQLDQYFMQVGIDSIYLKDFIKGFQEGFTMDKDNKKVNAYESGRQIGIQFSQQMIPGMNQTFFAEDTTKSVNKDNLAAGFISSALKQKLQMDKEYAQNYVTELENKIREEQMAKQQEQMEQQYSVQYAEAKAENAKFLEDNKSKAGVVTLPSGLQYKVIKEGKGPKPAATSTVRVDYKGTTIDGKEFDSTAKQGKPAEFPLNGVIAGWTEGIQLMSVGSKYILYIPYDLAYGVEGRQGSIPPYATLIFDVDLHDIVSE
jgi:FKBP-type peptidyl-prolyl cis-trans isomerase FklB